MKLNDYLYIFRLFLSPTKLFRVHISPLVSIEYTFAMLLFLLFFNDLNGECNCKKWWAVDNARWHSYVMWFVGNETIDNRITNKKRWTIFDAEYNGQYRWKQKKQQITVNQPLRSKTITVYVTHTSEVEHLHISTFLSNIYHTHMLPALLLWTSQYNFMLYILVVLSVELNHMHAVYNYALAVGHWFNWQRNVVWFGAHLNINPLLSWQQLPSAQLTHCRADYAAWIYLNNHLLKGGYPQDMYKIRYILGVTLVLLGFF